MRVERGRGSWWDHPHWPSQTALLAGAVAPVVVGTGVAAHYHMVPAGPAVGALAVALLLAFGLVRLRGIGRNGVASRSGLAQSGSLVGVELAPVVALVLAAALGIWLAATTAWWLLAVGAGGVALVLIVGRRPGTSGQADPAQLALLGACELLAGWGTVWVDTDRITWLGVVAAILPASVASALWLLVKLRDQPTEPLPGRESPLVGLSTSSYRVLFQGLLVLALAVPLLITVPGLDGAECFLPWLLAPLGEGPLRNTRSADPSRRERAVRQMAVLLVGAAALLAVGIWAG